ncbi:hypothetical protein K2Y11_09660 [bacterium]|nr:hypothetical protein [bacterium]
MTVLMIIFIVLLSSIAFHTIAYSSSSTSEEALDSLHEPSRQAATLADQITADNLPIGELQSRALQGNTLAQTALGNAYHAGTRGVARNEAEAVKWWKKAAYSGNDPEAEAHISEAYRNGSGVSRDYAKADHWLALSILPNRALHLPLEQDPPYRAIK